MVSIDTNSRVQITLLGSLLATAVIGTASFVSWKGSVETEQRNVTALVTQVADNARRMTESVGELRIQLLELRYQLASIGVALSADNDKLKWFAEQLKSLNPELRLPAMPYK